MRLTAVLLLIVFYSAAQLDTARTIPLVCVHANMHLPAGDLSKRFGPDLGAGGAFVIKNRHNWVFGLEGSYIFGQNVKEDVLVNIRNADGFVIDNEGYPADLRISQRGLVAHAVLGKVFNVLSANQNSGLLVWVGAGFMQHHIRLYDAQQRIAAVKGDLSKGYDRLSAGLSLTQFVGYLFLSEHKFVNFYAGFEFTEGFTRSVRKYNYDTGKPDTAPRFDGLLGFRFGWILPLYKKKPDDFYYY
jgi:hypothetical protein